MYFWNVHICTFSFDPTPLFNFDGNWNDFHILLIICTPLWPLFMNNFCDRINGSQKIFYRSTKILFLQIIPYLTLFFNFPWY